MPAPSKFTQAIADSICEQIAEGKSLRTICAAKDKPKMSTIFRWLADDARKEFREQYVRAREAQADALFDEILNIADTPLIGVKTKTNEKGETETTHGDMIEHRRLQVDARKWMAGKLRPKKYGDKLELAGDQDSPLQVVVRKLTQ